MSGKLKRGVDPKPDIKLYEHLSEKERMIASFPYRNADPVLVKEKAYARKLVQKYNNLDEENEKERREILDELLNPACRGKKLFLSPPLRVDYGYNITIGNNLDANKCVFLDSAPITIGDNCLLAPNVHIYATTHPVDGKYRQDNDDYYELAFPVKIGDSVWIGGGAIICPGVTIGDNVVVGAGAVVIRDIPSNVVVAGNPAKIIRNVY